ncbi:hypothetical protein [Jannaschia aquimarina]|uniref:Uncharacterized protein n=1 Tax=Jannaschia aquimarina TaxID=935700 RepID=A0A0D1DCY8_9RHOB|nr:hypothetical protein [Jannaschia aquimarina]KIT17828.1 hypothetical protein jaqu_04170 [Jannaschia aquimarina]SNS90588.1 hypothetical protein SAMN05421775_103258 [Jannaschia aquimarina]
MMKTLSNLLFGRDVTPSDSDVVLRVPPSCPTAEPIDPDLATICAARHRGTTPRSAYSRGLAELVADEELGGPEGDLFFLLPLGVLAARGDANPSDAPAYVALSDAEKGAIGALHAVLIRPAVDPNSPLSAFVARSLPLLGHPGTLLAHRGDETGALAETARILSEWPRDAAA